MIVAHSGCKGGENRIVGSQLSDMSKIDNAFKGKSPLHVKITLNEMKLSYYANIYAI